MTAQTIALTVVIGAFVTFMVVLGGAHLYVLTDPKTRKRPAARTVQAARPEAAASARREAAVHA